MDGIQHITTKLLKRDCVLHKGGKKQARLNPTALDNSDVARSDWRDLEQFVFCFSNSSKV